MNQMTNLVHTSIHLFLSDIDANIFSRFSAIFRKLDDERRVSRKKFFARKNTNEVL